MHWRVKTSRWINHRLLGGSPKQMVSTRCYVEHRYGWTLVIDWMFYIIRREQHHCFNCYCIDVKEKWYATQKSP